MGDKGSGGGNGTEPGWESSSLSELSNEISSDSGILS